MRHPKFAHVKRGNNATIAVHSCPELKVSDDALFARAGLMKAAIGWHISYSSFATISVDSLSLLNQQRFLQRKFSMCCSGLAAALLVMRYSIPPITD